RRRPARHPRAQHRRGRRPRGAAPGRVPRPRARGARHVCAQFAALVRWAHRRRRARRLHCLAGDGDLYVVRYRRLGDSDFEVSAIALGSWLTYGGGIGKERTKACTRAAFEAGITFFDTANSYGRGAAERAWGEILRDYPRDSFTIATKAYYPMSASD